MSRGPDKALSVLHLFSNCKWTGPAEPALNLCLGLRDLGIEADFACAPDAGSAVNKVVETARDRGIEPILRFHLSKHRHPLKNFADRRELGRLLGETHYDIVHCHLDNDHRIAIGPARRAGIPVVRSNYGGLGLPETRVTRRLLAGTSFLVQPSEAALRHDASALGFASDRMSVVPGAVDVTRFDPVRETPDGRRWLGLPPDAFVVGIVARMQGHRHYADLFGALARLVQKDPRTHLVVVGRGTRQEEVGFSPVRDLGLEKHVHFPGYIDGENYVGMLRAFDVGVFLVPGSDGTCRAVREIMSMGKPMVVADRGMLAEIVSHGRNGLVFDGNTEGLLESLDTLRAERRLRHEFGRNARADCIARHSIGAQSAAVRDVYEQVLRQVR